MFKNLSIIFFILTSFSLSANERHYTLNIAKGSIQVGEYQVKDRILVNSSLPAPTLNFIEGETAVIKVINKTDQKTLIHWHGLLIKNDQDGVPYVNSLPIDPKSEKTYRFKLRQTGTYWYHSHVMFQEQDGMYGAFVIRPKNQQSSHIEKVVLLSDFSRETGEQIERNIKKQGEYYDVLKGTVQSWWKAFKTGNAITKWRNSFQRMEGMDYADIAYDHFLMNGKPSIKLLKRSQKKEKVLIRIINGSASSIFKLTYGGQYMTVVSADGLPVVPIKVTSLPISVAETYDIELEIDPEYSYELKATSIDKSGYAKLLLGSGNNLKEAPDIYWEHPIGVTMGEMMGMSEMGFFSELAMNYRNEFKDVPRDTSYSVDDQYRLPSMDLLRPMMKDHHEGHSMKSTNISHRIMNRSPELRENNILDKDKGIYKELSYDLLRAKSAIDVSSGRKLRTTQFTLNGNMGRYVWSINGRPLGPETYIKIKKGERARFIIKNTTMMNHPMHLHGHFFRVMTSQGKWSVRKHTVNVAPLDQVVIEFDSDEEKDWFFHCHILYHMMGGMTRIVRYEDSPGPQKLEDARKKSKEFNHADSFFLRSRNFVQSNYYRTETSFFNSFYAFDLDVVGDYNTNLEGELHVSRILTRYLEPYVGVKTEAEEGSFKTTPTIGFTWVLPLNISVDLKYQPEMEDEIELEFESEIQLTSKLQLNYEYSSVRNFYSELEYRQTKNLSFVTSYNKTFEEWGLGLAYTY